MMLNRESLIKIILYGLLIAGLLLIPFSASATSEKIPTGTYKTTVTEDDLPPGLPPEVVQILAATWELVLHPDQSFNVLRDGELVVEGRYVSNPSRLILYRETGPLACSEPGLSGAGVYDWSTSGDDLELSTVHDACLGRNVVLTANILEKQ